LGDLGAFGGDRLNFGEFSVGNLGKKNSIFGLTLVKSSARKLEIYSWTSPLLSRARVGPKPRVHRVDPRILGQIAQSRVLSVKKNGVCRGLGGGFAPPLLRTRRYWDLRDVS